MASPIPSWDLTRTTLAVLFIAALIVANFLVLKPFLAALVWAGTIVVATWPLMLRLQALLGGKRRLAVAVMTLVLLLLLVIPVALAIITLQDNAGMIRGGVESLKEKGLSPPPGWVSGIPIVGPRLSEWWGKTASAGPGDLSAQVAPYVEEAIAWFFHHVGGVGMMLVQFVLTVIVAAILYSGGESVAGAIRRFSRRLAGERGENMTVLAARAIQGVALGVVVTALAQSLIGGVGLAVAGVPAAGVLTAIMFMFCIAQIGPLLILLPAVIWLYWSGHPVSGTVLLAISVAALVLDNVLRPVLIKKHADLPLLLIFAGVIGGLMAFGVVGLFIGPVVLAVTYTLLGAWVTGGASGRHGQADQAP